MFREGFRGLRICLPIRFCRALLLTSESWYHNYLQNSVIYDGDRYKHSWNFSDCPMNNSPTSFKFIHGVIWIIQLFNVLVCSRYYYHLCAFIFCKRCAYPYPFVAVDNCSETGGVSRRSSLSLPSTCKLADAAQKHSII